MSVAASIVIELLAKTGSFETDMNRASKLVDQKFRAMGRSAERWIAGLASAFSVGVLVAKARELARGLDELKDTAEAIGTTVENFSALEDIAMRTGTSMDALSTIMLRFNKVLTDAQPESSMAKALAAIGMQAEQLRQMDPSQALQQVAISLTRYADDANKARLIQELFNRSAREAAPFLNDLANAGQLNAKVTAEQAARAERFAQMMASFDKTVTDASRNILTSLIPVLERLAFQLNVGMQNANGFWDALRKFGTLNPFRSTQSAIEAEQRKIDDLQTAIDRQNKATGGRFRNPAWERALQEAKDRLNYLKQIQQFEAMQGLPVEGYPDAVSRRLGAGQAGKPSVGTGWMSPDKDGSKKSLLESYIEQLQRSLDKTYELSQVEQTLRDIQMGRLGTLTTKQREQVLALAQQIDVRRDLQEQIRMGREAAIAEGDAVTRANEAYQDMINGLLQGGPQAQLEALRMRLKALADELEGGRISPERFLDAVDGLLGISDAAKRAEDSYRQMIQAMLDSGPEAKLEALRTKMLALRDEFLKGAISAQQFTDAATGVLGLDKPLERTRSAAEDLGFTFASAFEDAIVGGKGLSEVLKGLEQDILRILTRRMVTEPLADYFLQMFKRSGGNPLQMFINGIGSLFSGIFGGSRQGGGDVIAGRSYLVGEAGPERFVPRTTGTILPTQRMAGPASYVTVENAFTFSAPQTRATQQQIAAATGLGVRRALVRGT